MDIVEFYPTISKEILENAILFVQVYIDIPEKNLPIIKHCRKSLLYNDNEPWVVLKFIAKNHGSSLPSNKLDKQYTGLYRDDGQVLLRNTSKQKTDRIRKDIIEIFNNTGFKIEIKTDLHIVDFLSIAFDLLDGT